MCKFFKKAMLLTLCLVFAICVACFAACNTTTPTTPTTPSEPSAPTTPSEPTEPTITTEVTESEWTDAMTFKGIAVRYTATTKEDETEKGTRIVIMNSDKTALYFKDEYGGSVDEGYYAKESGKCYEYAKNSAGNWEKTEIEESTFNETISSYTGFSYEYSDFTYITEKKVYECEIEYVGVTCKETLSFENGKIVKYTETVEESGTIYSGEIELTYENVTLTLPNATEVTKPTTPSEPTEPTVITEVTESEWTDAMTFKGVAVRYTATTKENETEKGTQIVIMNSDKTALYFKDEYDGSVDEGYYAKESGKCYEYAKNSAGNWEKYEIEESEFNEMINTGFVEYSDFTYNPEKKLYEDEYEYEGVTCKETLSFENGKIVKYTQTGELEGTIYLYVVDFTYENVTLTLPEATEPTTPTTPSEGLNFFLDYSGTGYMVNGLGSCTDNDIVIPETYNGLPVIKIASIAFDECSSITSVIIPKSVTSIGNAPFAKCSSLTNISVASDNRIINQ